MLQVIDQLLLKVNYLRNMGKIQKQERTDRRDRELWWSVTIASSKSPKAPFKTYLQKFNRPTSTQPKWVTHPQTRLSIYTHKKFKTKSAPYLTFTWTTCEHWTPYLLTKISWKLRYSMGHYLRSVGSECHHPKVGLNSRYCSAIQSINCIQLLSCVKSRLKHWRTNLRDNISKPWSSTSELFRIWM